MPSINNSAGILIFSLFGSCKSLLPMTFPTLPSISSRISRSHRRPHGPPSPLRHKSTNKSIPTTNQAKPAANATVLWPSSWPATALWLVRGGGGGCPCLASSPGPCSRACNAWSLISRTCWKRAAKRSPSTLHSLSGQSSGTFCVMRIRRRGRSASGGIGNRA